MNLLDALAENPLLGDGAMGTQLQEAGLEPGGCGEAWNLEHPDRVLAIQGAYVAAGSQCLLTNTFGACAIMLARHDEEGRVEAINRAGVELARQALGPKGFVLGGIGPFGGLLEPLGEVAAADVERAFREQARSLVEAGADAVVIETQTSLEELEIGLRAAREAGAPVVIGSMAFDLMRDGSDVRTMMGVGPEQAAEFMAERGADIVALNCGTGIDMVWAADIVARYRSTSGLPVMAKPNAGQPVLRDMKVLYEETPLEMAAGVARLLEAGARLIGGCCGSTPAHIRELRRELDRRVDSGGVA